MKSNEVGCDGHIAGGVPWTSNCNVVNIGKNYKFKYHANFTILEIIGEGLIKI